ncbi:P pilus assembly protein chaperone PapD-like protein [Caballeronia calidae]|uniref:P pilus assembly protein chaperone PapD-like protein n=2 Tax=Caballeronia calidae TaxID=1777139 RepID=A0A158EH80_9BURK|nr:P pilus assembly protein chaperone PapD-like protein [Caballeronia calidae]
MEFQPGQRAQGLWLRNSGDAPIHAQVRVQHWSQTDHKDTLDPTHNIVASPPFIAIAPHAEQLVRIVPVEPPTDTEQAYRLLIDELPETQSDGAPKPAGLTFLIRYSIPIFLSATSAVPSNPDHSSGRDTPITDLAGLQATLNIPSPSDRTGTLVVTNTGRQHIKISELAFLNTRGSKTILSKGLLGYVLPHSQMSWTLHDLPAPATLSNGKFEGKINEDLGAQELPITIRLP